MSMSANLHNVASFRCEDLYKQNPGQAITLYIVDDKGNEVVGFLTDKTLKILTDVIQLYAAKREEAPVEPKPTYAEALFSKPVVPADSYIPF